MDLVEGEEALKRTNNNMLKTGTSITTMMRETKVKTEKNSQRKCLLFIFCHELFFFQQENKIITRGVHNISHTDLIKNSLSKSVKGYFSVLQALH